MDTPRCEIVLPRAAYVVGAILLGGYVVYWLRDVLTPIFLAFSLAYLLDPLVDRLEAWRGAAPGGHRDRARGHARRRGAVPRASSPPTWPG